MNFISTNQLLALTLAVNAFAAGPVDPATATPPVRLRPPAVPLVAHDPYFSIWSPADQLTDADTVHWTGRPHRLTSQVRIDGKPFRVMGKEPTDVPALPQAGVEVLPTRTVYTFAGQGVRLTLTFLTPALPDDLEVLARPVTYVTHHFAATDGQPHDVSFVFSAGGEICRNEPDQALAQTALASGPPAWLNIVKIGTESQPVLARTGDDLRIDWGWLYLAASQREAAAAYPDSRAELTFAPFKISAQPVTRWLMLAYDDEYSIQYMKKNLRPYWRRNGDDAAALLRHAAADYESLKQRCEAFDEELMADLRRIGGEKYAQIGALAYRQCFAAGKFVVDANGQPLQFCKENHSNGCIGTSDVFYPMAPQFLLFGPTLAKSFLVPFMNYAASDRWKFPFAPHDLGTYPQANGQVYGGGERTPDNQMPVEESGNLLILMGAIAQMEGNADFAGRYWKQLETWAEYLKMKGFDPENQLCTDDFAGHLAHNVNLSAKAIVALGAFGKLCERRGEPAKAAEYSQLAREFARRWVQVADDGDHFRLAFDRPGTWSQKYNLVWDRILGLNLFPAEVATKEMAYYRKTQNGFGLPLDNRKDYTKLDWTLWTATLTQERADFEALVEPVFRFLHETPDRSPMTDWYQTKSARKVGFTARPVVGGVFIPLLYDQAIWKKYAGRDRTKADHWAPFPKQPVVTTLVPTSEQDGQRWRYTTHAPAGAWFELGYDAGTWSEGPGGFGTKGTPNTVGRTIWDTSDIWLRREFTLTQVPSDTVQVRIHHDEVAEVYLNGVLVRTLGGYSRSYEEHPLQVPVRAVLQAGRNVLAVHCRQTSGGQYIDAGLVTVREP